MHHVQRLRNADSPDGARVPPASQGRVHSSHMGVPATPHGRAGQRSGLGLCSLLHLWGPPPEPRRVASLLLGVSVRTGTSQGEPGGEWRRPRPFPRCPCGRIPASRGP